MPEIISVHSFRGGTGKSNLVANLATSLAMQGHRVAIVDTDIQSPGVHMMFGMDEQPEQRTLNDYLWSRASIEEAAFALNKADDPQRPFLKNLHLWLVPSSLHPNDIAKVLREGYDVNLLQKGFHRLVKSLDLDYLIIDTHPGLDEETLLAIAMSNTLLLTLRTDKQDKLGTAVTIDIAQRLEVPKIRLVINYVPSRYDFPKIKQEMSATYDTPVAGVLPISEDVAANASGNVFCALYPDHPWTQALSSVIDEVAAAQE
jgi:septum site-determining protein MinD